MTNEFKVPNLVDALYQIHAKNIKRYPCHTNRASAIGSPCIRQLVYMRTCWEKAELPSIEKQLIFDEGNEHERIVMSNLLKTDYEIVEQQVSFVDKQTNISGHLDAIVQFEQIENQTVVATYKTPLEFKSCSPYIFDAISKYPENQYMKAMEELGEVYPWLKKYPAQILLYCFSKGSKFGIIIFKNKSNGRMKQFVLDLEENMTYLDAVFDKAKTVNKIVAKLKDVDPESDDAEKVLPPKINSPDDCKFCDYCMICKPDIHFGNPLQIKDNPTIEKSIDNFHLFDHFKKAHDKTNKYLKDVLKGVDNVIVGKWHVTGKESKSGAWLKKFAIADELKMDEIKRNEKRIKQFIAERTSGNAETN